MTAIVAACAPLFLAGCAISTSSYSALDRELHESDRLPEALPGHALRNSDEETARLVATHDGTGLWLMRGHEPGTVCLLAYPNDEQWGVVCGSEGGVGIDGLPGVFRVVPDGAPAPDGGATLQISENIYTTE